MHSVPLGHQYKTPSGLPGNLLGVANHVMHWCSNTRGAGVRKLRANKQTLSEELCVALLSAGAGTHVLDKQLASIFRLYRIAQSSTTMFTDLLLVYLVNTTCAIMNIMANLIFTIVSLIQLFLQTSHINALAMLQLSPMNITNFVKLAGAQRILIHMHCDLSVICHARLPFHLTFKALGRPAEQ